MATRKNAKKTTKKVDISGLSEFKVSAKTKQKAERTIKRTSLRMIAFAFLALFVGFVLGAGAWWFVCRNDCFEIVGQAEITLTVAEKYGDEGVEIVAFGNEESGSVTIETNMKRDDEGNFYSDEVGTFYIKYKSNCFKYGTLFKVQKVRLITFVEASEGGE